MEDFGQYIINLFENNKKQVQAYPPVKSDVTFGLAEIKIYILSFFEKNRNAGLVYHNLNHTLKVVSRVREISKNYALNPDDSLIVECAAWFHDTGYLIRNEPAGHELAGAELAEKFLTENLVANEIIDNIKACIMATVLPQSPQTLLQQILCDADLYHFGTAELFFQDILMHKEVEIRNGKAIDRRRWTEGTINLLSSHSYQTEYCKRLLSRQKSSNLNKLEMILSKMNSRQ